jgi:hypothetical protein
MQKIRKKPGETRKAISDLSGREEGGTMATDSAVTVAARLDRLPASRYALKLITLVSLGGWFEFYDLRQHACSPSFTFIRRRPQKPLPCRHN